MSKRNVDLNNLNPQTSTPAVTGFSGQVQKMKGQIIHGGLFSVEDRDGDDHSKEREFNIPKRSKLGLDSLAEKKREEQRQQKQHPGIKSNAANSSQRSAPSWMSGANEEDENEITATRFTFSTQNQQPARVGSRRSRISSPSREESQSESSMLKGRYGTTTPQTFDTPSKTAPQSQSKPKPKPKAAPQPPKEAPKSSYTESGPLVPRKFGSSTSGATATDTSSTSATTAASASIEQKNEESAPEVDWEAEDRRMDRNWYSMEEGGIGIESDATVFMGNPEKIAKMEEELTKVQVRKLSARQSALNEDNTRWEENRMLTSGVVMRDTVDTDFAEETENKVQLLVHDLKPPFLDGRVVFTTQQELVPVVKDATSDIAVLARKGSSLLREVREQQERWRILFIELH